MPEAPAPRSRVLTPAGKSVVIVGKAWATELRKASGRESRLQRGAVDHLGNEPRFWIDARLIDVPAALIQSIEFKPAAVLCSRCIASIRRTTPSVSTAFRQAARPRMDTPWRRRRRCSRVSMRGCRSDEHHRFRSADPGSS